MNISVAIVEDNNDIRNALEQIIDSAPVDIPGKSLNVWSRTYIMISDVKKANLQPNFSQSIETLKAEKEKLKKLEKPTLEDCMAFTRNVQNNISQLTCCSFLLALLCYEQQHYCESSPAYLAKF